MEKRSAGGSKDEQRDKHWKAFQYEESRISNDGEMLLKKLQHTEAKALVADFLKAHQVMGEGYQQGFQAFKEANYQSAAGDAAVKGMDRAPAKPLFVAILGGVIVVLVLVHSQILRPTAQLFSLMQTESGASGHIGSCHP
jgi:hypothetical protein